MNTGRPSQRCPSCSDPIVWAFDEDGYAVPVNVDLTPGGDVLLIPDPWGAETPKARFVSPSPEWAMHTNHFATCAVHLQEVAS